LRKDFIIDPYQIAESRALGADAVLLIVRALPDPLLGDLAALAGEWGLDALVEVHDEKDLERALALPNPIVGINNRDLDTMTTDLEVTERLTAQVPPWVTVVSESGIETRRDIERLGESGVRAFLIGASLLRSGDPTKKLKELRGFLE
jgi:indole-3-glycerol phosphate synthase